MQIHFKIVRLLWEESAGLLPMVWPPEDVRQEHSADPGCLMEELGMGHLPGTASLFQSWPLEPLATTA